jgi:hypothetical protein
MDSETFWNLTWWDWNLWVERIIEQRKEKGLNQEYEWQRLSHLLTPIYNFMRDGKKQPTAFKPTDFFKPSWITDEPQEEDTRTPEEILSQFPKKFEDVLKLKNG